MKLLGVLLLCVQLLSNKAVPILVEDADCNDPVVFQAMAVALRSYNAKREDGNQFALFKITDAKAIVGNDTYTVAYQVFETTCEVRGGKSWQSCDYKPEMEAQRGQCTAQVHINEIEKINEVLHQDCKINPAESPVTNLQAPCLGCEQPIPVNSNELQKILIHVIKKFNIDSQHPSLFGLKEVKNATIQVVNGWVYKIDCSVQETNCSRDKDLELNPQCEHLENGESDDCRTHVFVSPENVVLDVKQKCSITDGNFCHDCTVPVDINSQELQEPVTRIINKINSNSKEPQFYNLVDVNEAKTQEVRGKKYQIKLQVKETNCSKKDYESLTEACMFTDGGKQYMCSAGVDITPDQEADFPVACYESMLGRHIPGLSPFRSSLNEHPVPMQWKPSGRHRRNHGPPQGHGHGHGHGRGHQPGCDHKRGKPKKDKKGKGKHDNKCDSSSEESVERITMKPHSTIFTTSAPETPISTPDPIPEEPTQFFVEILDDLDAIAENTEPLIPELPVEPAGGNLDLPDAFSLDLPVAKPARCPGNQWKPIPDLYNPNTLADPTAKNPIIEKAVSVDPERPAVPGTFSDADLLD